MIVLGLLIGSYFVIIPLKVKGSKHYILWFNYQTEGAKKT